uniref:Protein FAM216A n=1 Tax=Astatotilapia calliptera TaxID=8154 RepID=A0A3P8PHG8_ASTCA
MEFQNSAGNVNSGLKISRPADQRLTAIQIPTSVTTASFLKHAALTPAQRKYLYSIAASYSTEHVRRLVTQHYMNVQYRCIRAGARIRLSDEEEEQGGPNDSLSECLSSLSVGGWDGDSLSDL